MTRRKDKIKQKKEEIQKCQNLSKSRIQQKQVGITNEIILLDKIKKLPDDLIRIIYNYMSGNAKLLCNAKFDFLEKKVYRCLHDNLDRIENLSKQTMIDFMNKGFLQKYPDIVESIDAYYYCLDVEEYQYVNGNHLFNLWESNSLVNHYDNLTDPEEKKSRIDWSIKFNVRYAIYDFIISTFRLYRGKILKTTLQKNWVQTGNTLFLNLDKVFYLYKCLENMNWKIKNQ
jgi:hypothetical protein